ncbi:MAG: hypothetical protein V3S76_03290, partial [Candidatus Bipolaricaulota bacterium]
MQHTQAQQTILIEQREIVQSRYSMFMIVRFMLVGLVTLWGCTMTDRETDMSPAPVHTPPLAVPSSGPHVNPTAINHTYAAFSLEDRMLFSSTMEETPPPPPELGPLYSFRAHELPLIDALALFARSNRLNIVTGPEIEGSVTVDVHDLPLEQAMS